MRKIDWTRALESVSVQISTVESFISLAKRENRAREEYVDSERGGCEAGVGETVLKLPANRHKLSRFLKTPKKVSHLMKQ